MGDMADYYADAAFSHYEDLIDDEGREGGPAGIGCRYCHAGPLYWGETPKGWRLFERRGAVHTCTQYQRKELK